jgi:hypothetical protein
MKDGQEQMRAKMKAHQERMVAKMNSSLEEMKAHHEKIKDCQEEMLA